MVVLTAITLGIVNALISRLQAHVSSIGINFVVGPIVKAPAYKEVAEYYGIFGS